MRLWIILIIGAILILPSLAISGEISQFPRKDTCVFEYYPNRAEDFGNSKELYVSKVSDLSSNSNEAIILIDFNWSLVDFNKVKSVTLYVKHSLSWRTYVRPESLELYKCNKSWNEHTNGESFGMLVLGQPIGAFEYGVSGWFICKLPVSILKNCRYGFIIRSTKEVNRDDAENFYIYSSESSFNRPYILIEE